MQKLISAFVLGISLFLLFLPLTGHLESVICQKAPYHSVSQIPSPAAKTYTGKDFSIISPQKVPASMHAKAYCLFDADSRRTLLGSNEDKTMPMASTTKIMTCLLAIEKGNLSSKVKVSSYAASMPDVQLNMQTGDSFYLKDLLYSLMLESHNDTAVAIAEHIGGSVEGFARLMNQRAQELGCSHTHFVTPNGLDAKEHYTTARELCLIASYAIQNKTFCKIINTPSYSFQDCSGKKSYSVHNHDAFLTSYPGALGIKTGFTGNAGYCFCGAARRNGHTLISAVLACGWPPHKSYKWTDTKTLMGYGFTNFQTVSVDTPAIPKKLPVLSGTKYLISVKRTKHKKVSLPLSETDSLTVSLRLQTPLKAPIRQGDIIAQEEYSLNGKVLYRFPVTAKESVPKRTLSYYQRIIKQLFLLHCLTD